MTTQRSRRKTVFQGSSEPLVRLMLAVLALLAVLFGGYELLERWWLPDADPQLLANLHRIRGLAAALGTGALVSWMILREGQPLVSARPPQDLPERQERTTAYQRRLHHARWFIRMRWIAIVVAAILVVATVPVAELLPAYVGPPLLALIAILAMMNLAYAIWLSHGRASPRFLTVQAYADLVILTLLLHFSGGLENPLTPLMLLHVIIAGVVLGRRESYRIAVVGSVLFALLAFGEWSGLIPHYTLEIYPHHQHDGILFHAAHHARWVASRVVLHAVILLLVAHFTTTLAERVRRDERRLEAFADEAIAQTQLLERALDSTETALCVCGHDGTPSWSNSRWQSWLRQVPEIGGDACPSVGLDAGLGAGGPLRFQEITVPGPAPAGSAGVGEARVFRLATAPLVDRSGEVAHVVTLAHDISEQKRAEARVVRAERLAAVGELAGQVAHEVNNPIAIIGSKARLLLRAGREELPPHASGELEKIAALSDRVARIARGLLSYCRPSPGARLPLDARVPARRALTFVEGRASAAGVRIEDELPEALPPVRANAGELEQVFLNLYLNALDAMPAGGRLGVGATLASTAGDGATGWLEIVVTDTGHGVPAEIRDRVFEPFLTTKTDGAGSGLGLSICLGLVRSHGGEIYIDSAPAQPTRVVVRLPTLEAPTPLLPEMNPQLEAATDG
jgi:signal transduction histidine kinase